MIAARGLGGRGRHVRRARSLREAAYGLGAAAQDVDVRVVFPAAVSGIVAALILGISRAIGETMVVAIAAGGTGGSLLTWTCSVRADDDRGHASLATGPTRSDGGPAPVQQPVLRWAAPVRLHLRAQRGQRAVRPPGQEAVLMATRRGPRARLASTEERRDLQGRRGRPGPLFEWRCCSP